MLISAVKIFASFCKGPAYANTLRAKMEAVKEASKIINNEAEMGMHQRLKEIHDVALDSKP